MKAFPMFIKTTNRRVIIVGGREQAAQKARLILKTDARLVLAALELEPELQNLVDTGRAEHYSGPLTDDVFIGAAMAFVATGCLAVDVCAHAIAQAARCPVNVVKGGPMPVRNRTAISVNRTARGQSAAVVLRAV